MKQQLSTLPPLTDEYVSGTGWIRGKYDLSGIPEQLYRSLFDTLEQLLTVQKNKATQDEIAAEFLKLCLATKSRNSAQIDVNLQLATYLDDLLKCPAPIVIEAMRGWPEKKEDGILIGKWFPTKGELLEEIKDLASKYFQLKNQLAARLDNKDKPRIKHQQPVDASLDERNKSALLLKLMQRGFFAQKSKEEARDFALKFYKRPFQECQEFCQKVTNGGELA